MVIIWYATEATADSASMISEDVLEGLKKIELQLDKAI